MLRGEEEEDDNQCYLSAMQTTSALHSHVNTQVWSQVHAQRHIYDVTDNVTLPFRLDSRKSHSCTSHFSCGQTPGVTDDVRRPLGDSGCCYVAANAEDADASARARKQTAESHLLPSVMVEHKWYFSLLAKYQTNCKLTELFTYLQPRKSNIKTLAAGMLPMIINNPLKD